jgi:hypothetical protein
MNVDIIKDYFNTGLFEMKILIRPIENVIKNQTVKYLPT